MDKIYIFITNALILNKNQNAELQVTPSSDIIMNLAKNYSELKLFIKAVTLYDICLKINDEDVMHLFILLVRNLVLNSI